MEFNREFMSPSLEGSHVLFHMVLRIPAVGRGEKLNHLSRTKEKGLEILQETVKGRGFGK